MGDIAAAIAGFAAPLALCLSAGAGWALVFGRPFARSLAPALIVQILLVFVSGLGLHRLTPGVVSGVVFAAGMLAFGAFVNRARPKDEASAWQGGLAVFTAVYVLLFISDIGKGFLNWDEFAHWGMFIKDSLRLDDLYLASDLPYSHKDYVPAVTLFQVMWARLAGGYSELGAYLALQTLMVALMFPIAYSAFGFGHRGEARDGATSGIAPAAALVALLALPLFFNTAEGFFFYHSIYLDYASGLMIGYCAFLVFSEAGAPRYRTLLMALGLSLLVLTKMTLAAMYVAVLALFALVLALERSAGSAAAKVLALGASAALPAGLWLAYNRAAAGVPAFDQAAQSYGGMNPKRILAAAFDPENAGIAYLGEVRSLFWQALSHRHVILGAGYLPVLAVISVAAFGLAFAWEGLQRRLAFAAGIWIVATGLGHALMMYLLYATSFTEVEALRLASYERYMNTFLVGAIVLVGGLLVASGLWSRHWRGGLVAVAVALAALGLVRPEAFRQLEPGVGDPQAGRLKAAAQTVVGATEEDATVYVLTRGDDGRELVRLRYFGHPRHIEGGSLGPAGEGDSFSRDLDPDGLLRFLGRFDYLYVNGLDGAFVERYGAVLDSDSKVEQGRLFRIRSGSDGKLELEAVE